MASDREQKCNESESTYQMIVEREKGKQMIAGITRVRNESLIIEDTLRHFLGFVDHIFLYDDASEDNTVEIASSFVDVSIIRNNVWARDPFESNSRHRRILLDAAVGFEWCLCFDADERIVGGMPCEMDAADGYRFRLFDAYLTPECREPYSNGQLAYLPRMWGPEYRDILMLFRTAKSAFRGVAAREPVVDGHVQRGPALVKHFGKCLSVEHWEETCDFYSTYFPEPYRKKWAARKGRAIHQESDFGRPLEKWGTDLFAAGVKL